MGTTSRPVMISTPFLWVLLYSLLTRVSMKIGKGQTSGMTSSGGWVTGTRPEFGLGSALALPASRATVKTASPRTRRACDLRMASTTSLWRVVREKTASGKAQAKQAPEVERRGLDHGPPEL